MTEPTEPPLIFTPDVVVPGDEMVTLPAVVPENKATLLLAPELDREVNIPVEGLVAPIGQLSMRPPSKRAEPRKNIANVCAF